MRCIDTFRGGMYIADVYLCRDKQITLTKDGKEYGNLAMQDKIGTVDAKIWDLGSPGVGKFETMDYVHVKADVTLFQNSLQLNMCRIRRAQEGGYVEADYLPVSEKDTRKMYKELLGYTGSMKNPYLQKLLYSYPVGNVAFAKTFQSHFAVKTVHHGFVGDLLEYALSMTRLCDHYAGYCPMVNCDLLLTAAISCDIGKTGEFSRFPESDYTDDGQLLGHIITGTEMVGESIRSIPGFLEKLTIELKHCILAHHGELEYDSPRKPALLETLVLNFTDNTDAKVGTMMEALRSDGGNKEWLGYNRLPESNIRKTAKQALGSDDKEK